MTDTAPPVVFTKYPSPATAVKVEVFTACHEVPPELSTKDKTPEPESIERLSASVPLIENGDFKLTKLPGWGCDLNEDIALKYKLNK